MDSKKPHKFNLKSRILFRYIIVFGVLCLFALMISFKCCQTTIFEGEYWRNLLRQQNQLSECQHTRGNILAVDSTILATSSTHFNLRIDYRSEMFNEPLLTQYIDELSDSLAMLFPGKTSQEWKNHLAQPLTRELQTRPRAHLLVRDISLDDYARLRTWPFFNQKNRIKSGIYLDEHTRRDYPCAPLASRTIGLAIEDSSQNMLTGAFGLEKGFDRFLRGDNRANGANILTTIDPQIQMIAHNTLDSILHLCEADWGTAVLMDVKTGDIAAIVNLDLDTESGQYHDILNRAVLKFEPGTIFNTIPMTIAIEDGLVSDTSEVMTSTPYAYAGGRPITDPGNSKSVKVANILAQSATVGLVKIMHRQYDLTPADFKQRLEKTGFLMHHNIGITGETTPYIPSVENDNAGRINLSRQFIGYNIETSPLSILAWYNAIANDGKYVRPRLVKSIISEDRDSIIPVSHLNPTLCSPQTASIVRKMLEKSVWSQYGTARFLRDSQVAIAGKTGTCMKVEYGQYNMHKRRLSFVGYFPAEAPRYSCIVMISNPQKRISAQNSSGIVVKNIALTLHQNNRLN